VPSVGGTWFIGLNLVDSKSITDSETIPVMNTTVKLDYLPANLELTYTCREPLSEKSVG
jgi:hypothetical protein